MSKLVDYLRRTYAGDFKDIEDPREMIEDLAKKVNEQWYRIDELETALYNLWVEVDLSDNPISKEVKDAMDYAWKVYKNDPAVEENDDKEEK